MARASAVLVALGLASAPALGGVQVIDFTTEDDGVTALVNGQEVGDLTGGVYEEFGNLFNLTHISGGAGLSIFDTSFTGPNIGGGDPDLIVGLGNILIIQENNNGLGTQTVDDIFDTANDDAGGGVYRFDFFTAVEMLEVTLVDVNGGNDIDVTLIDSQGLTRVYSVPAMWTNDISVSGPLGYGVLDLTSLAPQSSEGGNFTNVSQDLGFNSLDVVAVEFQFFGSGGIDNLTFIPTPGVATVLGLGLLASRRRR
ncbi:MAG: hypothetical protein AAGB51_02465 [Planctomycetota bacterium]